MAYFSPYFIPYYSNSSRSRDSSCALYVGLFVVFSWICRPALSLVYTDGDLAVLVEGEKDATNSSCAVHSARHGLFLSAFLEARSVPDVLEVDTATVHKMAASCLHDFSGVHLKTHRVEKRSVFDIFRGIYPGTKWCGIGNIADGPGDFGRYRHTDMCCQKHDSCAHFIPARVKRYGVYNESPFTVSSCYCDTKLRGCLREVDSFVSRTIEFLFFTLGNLKCLTSVRASTPRGNEVRRAVLVPVSSLAAPKQESKRSSMKRWFRDLFGGRRRKRRRRDLNTTEIDRHRFKLESD